ncbi:uncharacterized protein V1518DRAFT_409355 [Limtongia smithiae]|uniref:uncharacterized protein n=1 Tax=Limtongia smithiae TaxID=1125753 RepID=UPI0034CD62DB
MEAEALPPVPPVMAAEQSGAASDINIEIGDKSMQIAAGTTMDVDMDAEPSRAETVNGEDQIESAPRPEGVLLLGVDHMSTGDVKAYASTYLTIATPEIEWVDDTSVVFVYGDADTASKALEAFTSEAEFYDGAPEAGAIRAAKAHPQNGKYSLQVRAALTTDKKDKQAWLKSRYYLLYGDPKEEDYQRRRDDDSHRRDRERRRSRSPRRERRRRSASPESMNEPSDAAYRRSRDRDADFDDGFPSVLSDRYSGTKSTSTIDRYVPSGREPKRPTRRTDRYHPLSRGGDSYAPEYRSRSPGRLSRDDRDRDMDLDKRSGDRERGSSGLGDRIGRRRDSAETGRLSAPENDALDDFASRLGAKEGGSKSADSAGAADFASRLSKAPEEGGKRRRRAHHLEFD